MSLGHIKHWIFDLDNTLYSGDANFFAQIDKKITAYIADFLSLPPAQARRIQKQYLFDYGTSLTGLMDKHGIDPDDFLYHAHDVDLSPLIPNPDLRNVLAALPGQKFIFTNGSRQHAKNVGEHLKIYDLFDQVFAIEDADYIAKPQRLPYELMVKKFNIDPACAFMAEDTARNLEIPKQMGMATLLVGEDTDVPPYIDHVTNDLTAWLGEKPHEH